MGVRAPLASASISARFIRALIFCRASPSIGGSSGISGRSSGTTRLFTSVTLLNFISTDEEDAAEADAADAATEEDVETKEASLEEIVDEDEVVVVTDDTACTELFLTVFLEAAADSEAAIGAAAAGSAGSGAGAATAAAAPAGACVFTEAARACRESACVQREGGR